MQRLQLCLAKEALLRAQVQRQAEEEARQRNARAEEEARQRNARAEEEARQHRAAVLDIKAKNQQLLKEHYQVMHETDKEYKRGMLEVHKEHFAEQMAFEKSRAGALRNLTLYPGRLASWEIPIYGNLGRPLHLLTDTCTRVDTLIMHGCHASVFEELGDCIKTFCKASATEETVTDMACGQTFKASFVDAHNLDQLWKSVEDGCQLPTSLVKRKHEELTRHWGVPAAFNQGIVSQGVAIPVLPVPPPTAQEAEQQEEEEAVARIGVDKIRHINECQSKVAAYIETHADALRACTEFLENLALNRAGNNLMHTRLQQMGVYLPDACHRSNIEQELKESVALPKKTAPSKDELWRKRQGFKEVGACEVCGKTVRFDDYERAHVVASKNGKGGTNAEHNLLVACRDCNHGMGTCDALLYKDRLKACE